LGKHSANRASSSEFPKQVCNVHAAAMENHQQKTEKPAAECAAGFSEFDLWPETLRGG
jgi:hypothetical protein